MRKVYVEVIVRYRIDGAVLPLAIVWEDGHKYEIDKVKDVRKAASLKVGGVGYRYTVVIQGKEKYLFFETTENKWFVEANK